jgi:5'-phosphate synthase pdxT subunit
MHRRDGDVVAPEHEAPPIGILAVQGDFALHRQMLERLGRPARLIRRPDDLAGLAGIIIPGGESTTMLKVCRESGLFERLRTCANDGVPFFGTCAGLILMAGVVENPPQESLGMLAVTVRRNGYGRQIDSFVGEIDAPEVSATPLEGVFIRAPVITELGPAVQVLGQRGGQPVLVRQGPHLAATFHPELTEQTDLHRYFLAMIDARRGRRDQPQPDKEPSCPSSIP